MSDLHFSICNQKKGKFRIQGRISNIVLLRCRNKRPIKGLVRSVMTMKFSVNVMSPTSSCTSTVAIGASNFPFATINWNSSGDPSFNIAFGASNRILRKLASRMALDKASISMGPSMFNFPKSIGKFSFLWLFFWQVC